MKLQSLFESRLNIKQRLLQLQADLIERLPEEYRLSDFEKIVLSPEHGLGRYRIVVEINLGGADSNSVHCRYTCVILIDEIAPGAVSAKVLTPKNKMDSYEKLLTFNYEYPVTSTYFNKVWHQFEQFDDPQRALENLVNWLLHYGPRLATVH